LGPIKNRPGYRSITDPDKGLMIEINFDLSLIVLNTNSSRLKKMLSRKSFYVLITKIDLRYKLMVLTEANITWANYSGIRESEFFYTEFYTGTAQAIVGLFVEGIFLL